MTFGEFLDKAYQGLRRSLPVLIPGFAGLWALRASGPFGDFASFLTLQASFGGFLSLLLLVLLGSAVLGLLFQALRVAIFDLIRERVSPGELDPESRHAMHYALYANLAIAWPMMLFVRQLSVETFVVIEGRTEVLRGAWPWEGWGHAAFLLLFLWVEYALWEASLACFQKGKAGAKTARKKVAKKTGSAR